MFYAIIFIILAVFAGCRPKKEQVERDVKNDFHLRQCMAHVVDNPDVPFGFNMQNVVQDELQPENIKMVYQVSNDVRLKRGASTKKIKELHSLDEMKNFYLQSMELAGWNLIGVFHDAQGFEMFFEKPKSKLCKIDFTLNGRLEILLVNKKRDLTDQASPF